MIPTETKWNCNDNDNGNGGPTIINKDNKLIPALCLSDYGVKTPRLQTLRRVESFLQYLAASVWGSMILSHLNADGTIDVNLIIYQKLQFYCNKCQYASILKILWKLANYY